MSNFNFSDGYIDRARLKVGNIIGDREIPIKPGASNVFYNGGNVSPARPNNVQEAIDDLYNKINANVSVIGGGDFIRIVDGIGCGHFRIQDSDIRTVEAGYALEIERGENKKVNIGLDLKLADNKIFYANAGTSDNLYHFSLSGNRLHMDYELNKIDMTYNEFRLTDTIDNVDHNIAISPRALYFSRNTEKTDYKFQIANATMTARYHEEDATPKYQYLSNVAWGITINDYNFNSRFFAYNKTNLWIGAVNSFTQPWLPIEASNPNRLLIVSGMREEVANTGSALTKDDSPAYKYFEAVGDEKYHGVTLSNGRTFGSVLTNSTENKLGANKYLVGDPDSVKITIPKPMVLTEEGTVHGSYDYVMKKSEWSREDKKPQGDSIETYYTTETVLHTGNMAQHTPYESYTAEAFTGTKYISSVDANDLINRGLCYFRVPKDGLYEIRVIGNVTAGFGNKSSDYSDFQSRGDTVHWRLFRLPENTNSIGASEVQTGQGIANLILDNSRRDYINYPITLNKNEIIGFRAYSTAGASVIKYQDVNIYLIYLGEKCPNTNASGKTTHSADGSSTTTVPTKY